MTGLDRSRLTLTVGQVLPSRFRPETVGSQHCLKEAERTSTVYCIISKQVQYAEKSCRQQLDDETTPTDHTSLALDECRQRVAGLDSRLKTVVAIVCRGHRIQSLRLPFRH